MIYRSRLMTAAAFAAPLIVLAVASAQTGFAVLSEAELASARGLSPGYPQKTKNGTALTNNCATVNKPPDSTITANCSGVADNTECYACANPATQPAVDTSNPPSQKTGFVADNVNQTCTGNLRKGKCMNGVCENASNLIDTCNQSVPQYLQQLAPSDPNRVD